jgi:hypothetical protein
MHENDPSDDEGESHMVPPDCSVEALRAALRRRDKAEAAAVFHHLWVVDAAVLTRDELRPLMTRPSPGRKWSPSAIFALSGHSSGGAPVALDVATCDEFQRYWTWLFDEWPAAAALAFYWTTPDNRASLSQEQIASMLEIKDADVRALVIRALGESA